MTTHAKDVKSMILVAGAALLLATAWQLRSDATAAPAPPVACTFAPASPAFVALATTIGGIAIDDACEYVYLTNTTQNRVEVYSLQTQALLAPIQVGSQPAGLDLTPDGTLLYVANGGASNISVVDVASRVELRNITTPPPSFLTDTPFSIAIGNNGRALVAMRTTGSSGGRLMSLTLSTDQLQERSYVTDRTKVRASPDRGTIAIVEGGTSGGPVYTYDAATDGFSAEQGLHSDLVDIAISAGGTSLLVARLSPRLTVMDSSLRMAGNITESSASRGVAVDPDRDIGYRSIGTTIEVLNLRTFLAIGQLPLGDSVSSATANNAVGRMDISRDGALLAVVTNTGFSIVKTGSDGPPRNFDFLRNSRFEDGLNHWQTFATPDPSHLLTNVTAGVFQFDRVAPASGTGEAGILQETGQALPGGAKVEAQFSLGNSSPADRSITIVAGNAGFGSFESCTFVVAAGSALRPYRMRLETPQAWSNLTIAVYADTAGTGSGFNRLDNVSVVHDPALAVSGTTCTPPPPPPPSNGCGIVPAGNFVALAGTLGGILVDDACRYVYVANTTQNRIEVYSLNTMSFEAPIQVGAQPRSIEFSLDGKLLYVGNTGGTNISLVDLAQRSEVRKIHATTPSNETPFSMAAAANGRLLFAASSLTTTGGLVMELDLATEQTAVRADVPYWFASNLVYVKASGDRTKLIAINANSSGGPVLPYDSGSNSFGAVKQIGTFISDVNLDRTGSRALVHPGTYLLDSALNLAATITGGSGLGGVALDPIWPVGYRAVGTNIEVLNLSTLLQEASIPLGSSVSNASLYNAIGRMDVSADGQTVAVVTNNGFSIVAPPVAAPEQINFVQNGGFAGGLSGWLTFATPDPGYIDAGISGGVLEFNKLPVTGGGNQAVVFQETGVALPAGAPIQAQFDMGNSSTERKRISVLLLNYDFSDLHVCTFWLAPGAPLATYRMRSHSTRAWTNAAIYFYAATEGSHGGFNRIDNVSLTYDTSLPGDRTDCEDPTAPAAGIGPDSADFIANGDFGSGAIAPWVAFGTLTPQVAGGVLQFIRETDVPPAGAVLQLTGQPAAAGEIVSAAFELGNSSGVRKRVTVILHDANFNDLSACTFWLPPGQPLSAYSMRSFATTAWSNATVSFYAATVDALPWTQLDNVSLRYTPGTPTVGTECAEPGSVSPYDSGSAKPAAPAQPLAPTAAGPGAMTLPAGAGQTIEPDARVVGYSDWIDLTQVSRAELWLRSWLALPDAWGELQIRTAHGRWTTVAVLEPSDDWMSIAIDLEPWIGRYIAIRFVRRGDARAGQNPWLVGEIRVLTERAPGS